MFIGLDLVAPTSHFFFSFSLFPEKVCLTLGINTQGEKDITMRSNHFAFRAAIALNNMAVTMMERQCYRQGLETMKSAVSAFKLSTGCVKISARPNVPSDDAAAADNQRRAILVLLKQANRRSSKPQKSHLHSMPLRVVTQSGQSLAATTSNAMTPSASSQHTLIRLETTDDLDLLETDSDLTAAVILFNFAVSYLFRAMESVSSSANSCNSNNKKRRKESSSTSPLLSSQTKCIRAARKLLWLCSRLMEAQCEAAVQNYQQEENPCDSFHLQGVLFLSSTMLQTLLFTLQQYQQQQQEENWQRRISDRSDDNDYNTDNGEAEVLHCAESITHLRAAAAEMDANTQKLYGSVHPLTLHTAAAA